ncbi:MAG: tRNA (adenosine(37)-N6)-threonylcarbamoyltransferase complex ATPase subunit type 1 TsaE [Terriglobia bacterium]
MNRNSTIGDRQSSILAERVTQSPEETVLFGREIAVYFEPPCLVLLEGDLGAGKTTLVKGIVAGLGVASEDEVSSPSFTLVHEYGPAGTVYHADLYRIEGARDLATLGLEDLSGQAATVLVEWGEKLGDNAPRPCIKIRMEHLGSDNRRILIERVEA